MGRPIAHFVHRNEEARSLFVCAGYPTAPLQEGHRPRRRGVGEFPTPQTRCASIDDRRERLLVVLELDVSLIEADLREAQGRKPVRRGLRDHEHEQRDSGQEGHEDRPLPRRTSGSYPSPMARGGFGIGERGQHGAQHACGRVARQPNAVLPGVGPEKAGSGSGLVSGGVRVSGRLGVAHSGPPRPSARRPLCKTGRPARGRLPRLERDREGYPDGRVDVLVHCRSELVDFGDG